MLSAMAHQNKSQAQRLMLLMRNLRYRTTPAAMMVHRYPINLYALLGAAGGTTEEASRERENGRQGRKRYGSPSASGKIVEQDL
jgi:hypothetical protein